MDKLRGTGVAIVTPFTNAGEVDFSGLKKLVNHLISGGVEYLVVNGTTGESATTTSDEQHAILKHVLEANSARVPVVYGIGGNNTRSVTDRLRAFTFKNEVLAILSVSPYYNKPNQTGILNHYRMVADASPLPVMLYNVPGRTGSNVSAETTLQLAEHPNIFATKEASGSFDQVMEIMKSKPEGFMVISGDDAYTLPFVSLGMDGVVSVIANGFPRQFSEMVRLALSGRFAEARKLHYLMLDAMQLIFKEGSPGGIKEILDQQGICGTHVREPLANVSSSLAEKLRKITNEILKQA